MVFTAFYWLKLLDKLLISANKWLIAGRLTELAYTQLDKVPLFRSTAQYDSVLERDVFSALV